MSPLLLWKRFLSRHRLIHNYCKRCGRRTEAFATTDELYDLIIPTGEETCFRCFDAAARKAGRWPVWRVTME